MDPAPAPAPAPAPGTGTGTAPATLQGLKPSRTLGTLWACGSITAARARGKTSWRRRRGLVVYP